MVFRRIEDLSTGMAPPIAPLHHGQSVKSYVISKDKNGSPLRSHQILGKRKRKYDFEDEIINFRRVRIKGGMSSTRCKVYEHGDNGWFDHGTGSCHYLNIDVRASLSRVCKPEAYVNSLLTAYRAYLI